jgi:hypothetical protein
VIEKIASRFKISLSDANAIIFGNNQSANALKKTLYTMLEELRLV